MPLWQCLHTRYSLVSMVSSYLEEQSPSVTQPMLRLVRRCSSLPWLPMMSQRCSRCGGHAWDSRCWAPSPTTWSHTSRDVTPTTRRCLSHWWRVGRWANCSLEPVINWYKRSQLFQQLQTFITGVSPGRTLRCKDTKTKTRAGLDFSQSRIEFWNWFF